MEFVSGSLLSTAVGAGVNVGAAVEAFGFWSSALAFPTSRFTAEPGVDVLAGEGLAVAVRGVGVISGMAAVAEAGHVSLVAGVAG